MFCKAAVQESQYSLPSCNLWFKDIMVDYALFSDQEESAVREESSDIDVRAGAASPMANGDGIDVDSSESSSDAAAITPVRPPGNYSSKRKRRIRHLADSSSDEDLEDSEDVNSSVTLTGKEELQEIKGILKQLFKKVEKNSRKLTELQSARFVSNSLSHLNVYSTNFVKHCTSAVIFRVVQPLNILLSVAKLTYLPKFV